MPGLSIVLATPTPTRPLVADVKAVGNLVSTYAHDLPAILKGVRDPGQAIIVDDTAERAVVGRVIQ